MNDSLILLLVIIGGATGLAIIGVAVWMMRQDNTAEQQGNTAERQDNTAEQQGNTAEQPTSVGESQSDSVNQLEGAADQVSVESSNSLPLVTEADPQPIFDSSPDLISTGQAPFDSATPANEPSTQEPSPGPVPVSPANQVASPTPAPPPDAPSTPSKSATPNWFNALTSQLNPLATQSQAQELLRVLRSADGTLIVEVNGQRYQTRIDLNNERLEQQIANVTSDLGSFLSGPANAPVKATLSPIVPPPVLPPTPKPQPVAPPRKEQAIDNRPVKKVSLEEAKQMEVKPPTMDVMRQWRYIREQQKKPEIQIKSIMDEIDDILQSLIANTPLAGRGLKAADSAHGAVFTLDGVNYDSVDALPDAEARDLLRAAIQKWDQK